MNKMFMIGLFGGLGTLIYYCFIREKNKNENENDELKEIIKNENKNKNNELKEIIKNNKLPDIFIPEEIISEEVKKIIDNYVDDMINNEIKKHYQLIIYEKPKSLFELYLDDYWEIM